MTDRPEAYEYAVRCPDGVVWDDRDPDNPEYVFKQLEGADGVCGCESAPHVVVRRLVSEWEQVVVTDRPEDAATVIAQTFAAFSSQDAVERDRFAEAVLVALSEQGYSVTRDLGLIRDAEKLLAQFDDEMSLTGDEFEVLTRLRGALGEVS